MRGPLRPEGYVTYRRTPSGGWHTGRDARRYRGLRAWLNPGHGARLRAGTPTLLCHVDPWQGLGSAHCTAVREWVLQRVRGRRQPT
ncbi:hypothetical protein [Actinophytocola sp. NPDC049390]|uniref:hypothetical protein n=1 Tax=Actinophytocola sp. NPDC049390 TaxID=3363894 RepID=UPI0037901703